MKILTLTVGLNVSSPKKFFGGLWGLKKEEENSIKIYKLFYPTSCVRTAIYWLDFSTAVNSYNIFQNYNKHNDQQKKFKVIFEVINSESWDKK